MRYIIGVDIGGTNVVVGTVAEDGSRLHGKRSEPTLLSAGPGGTVDQVNRLVRESLAAARDELGGGIEVIGVGIGSPGPLDTQSGTVLVTPNLGWTEMPLRDRVATAAGLPATLDNDANCAVLGEWWRGAAQGGAVVVGLTIGTGIGGGIVLDGKVFHGASDVAGEIGHASIDPSGRRCKCGNYGCLEAYASGPAIALRAVEGLEAGADSRLTEYVNGDLAEITARTVSQAAREGDAFCLEVIRETAHYLGGAVANLLNIINPDIVVICGGVTLAGDHLFGPLCNEVRRRAFRPAVLTCRIVPGNLPGTAGVFGAVASYRAQTGESD
ncbi:MAG: ROK family protein [Gemmatimonadota bacterium]|nr:MAG: ROK family protein [Gemmatimonadota bacterium]